MDKNNKALVIYVATLVELIIIPIHSSCNAKMTLRISTKIFVKYSNFLNVLFLDSAMKLLEYARIKDYFINLLEDKQLPYYPIYNLKLMELEKLKIYIKANLASSFIRPFKFLAGASILFVWKKKW